MLQKRKNGRKKIHIKLSTGPFSFTLERCSLFLSHRSICNANTYSWNRVVNFVNRSRRSSFRLAPLVCGEWKICWKFSQIFYLPIQHFSPENVCYMFPDSWLGTLNIDDIISLRWASNIECFVFHDWFVVCCSLIDEKSLSDKNR